MSVTPQTVLFLRRFRSFQGGHLKVWDYYNHVRAVDDFTPQIWFTPDSVWNDSNPWLPEHDRVLPVFDVRKTDILFLAGMDWQLLDEDTRRQPPVPILNLIQHIRHADPADKRFAFLPHKAIRLCVSPETADAIRATGKVNGPVFVIPNGIAQTDLPTPLPDMERDTDLLIVGMKQPDLARALHRSIRKLFPRITILTQHLPRAKFLHALARSRAILLLPNHTEGFYLPAIEAMALGCLVICPDCTGNRSFCLDGENCFRPDYTRDAILAAIHRTQSLTPRERQTLLDTARHTAARHNLETERASFLNILRQTHSIWRQTR